eukprot:CAMPEP_0119373252 /NCGR_PEP_ID=MMETSP1334-20130426/24356_1 /TAXON_ID=127549 /ORGANISM="Calcidiscus leptoporus, Strain RCC1130" /LENGTH=34 /DNA_ID= /DNA_START= /DNA_END= /DNA_ORIENTATION=
MAPWRAASSTQTTVGELSGACDDPYAPRLCHDPP